MSNSDGGEALWRHEFMSSELQRVREKTLIVNTLDGFLYGFKGSQLIWTKAPIWGPNVKVSETTSFVSSRISTEISVFSAKTVFIPEPAGDGDLYIIKPGHPLEKVPISIRKILDEPFPEANMIFTGKRSIKSIALDPETGDTLAVFGKKQDSDGVALQNAIYLSRIEYTVNIWDKHSARLLWNIVFAEYTPTTIPKSPLVSFRPSQIATDVLGKFSIGNSAHHGFSRSFRTPVASLFDVIQDENGNNLININEAQKIVPSENDAFIGNMDGTLYILTDKQFPHLSKDVMFRSHSHDPHQKETLCTAGSKGFPDCIIGPFHLHTPNSDYSSYFYIVIFSFAIIYIFGRLFRSHSHVVVPQRFEELEPQNTEITLKTISSRSSLPSTGGLGLQSFELFDEILGHGSHGTVVFKGSFQGRPVAIKRLLSEFYDMADHEIKLLQESDHHPNICRYFHREICDGFMYIALELCAATLEDVIQKKLNPEILPTINGLTQKEIFEQIMDGLDHLHSLNIVHRDLKPQNILIQLRKAQAPVVLISDFGLGKKLADGQSSFHHTFGAGTAGWVAAECLEVRHMNSLKPVKITKAIDIFAAGCVFYYVLTNGKHPYGEMLTREHNIVKGNYRLRDLSDQNQDHILAKDLIKQMIPRHYQKRLSARNVQNHPYFWKSARKLDFLQAISDRLEAEIGKPQGSIIMGRIERNKESVIGDNWTIKLDEQVLEDMKKYRNYDSSSICHLLRLLRNKHHFYHLPANVKKDMGTSSHEFLEYWSNLFPGLFLHVYNATLQCEEFVTDPICRNYLAGSPSFKKVK